MKEEYTNKNTKTSNTFVYTQMLLWGKSPIPFLKKK